MHRIRMRALTGISMRLDKPSYNTGICGMRDRKLHSMPPCSVDA